MNTLTDENDVDVQDILSPHVIGSYLNRPQNGASERSQNGDETLALLELPVRIFEN